MQILGLKVLYGLQSVVALILSDSSLKKQTFSLST